MSDYSRSHWQPDSSRKDCAKCKSDFTFTSRRHHCRNCGGLFCNNCSSKQCPVPRRQINMPVRVCDPCYTTLNSAPEPVKPPVTAAAVSVANNAAASPARVEPPTQAPIAPSSDVVPQIPLANAYGIIKEKAGKAYLDVSVAAVAEVVYDESQCSEQQYEFDAAGAVCLALPTPSPQNTSAIAALLLADGPVNTDEIISDADRLKAAEGLHKAFDLPFPSLFVAFDAVVESS